MLIILIAAAVVVAVLGITAVVAMFWRTVVPTNETHIVQSAKTTISYGKDQSSGNVYYHWPSWIPRIGIKVIKLPVSVFSLKLESYPAYDKGRVPFALDIMGFFQVDDPNTAAQRITSVPELEKQLVGILQGATRSILAGAEINEILEKRAEYGHQFTEATTEQLTAWGVKNVKTIELMDIHDVEGSKVISNIMAVKQSEIARSSRVTVALNNQQAQQAEINSTREVEVRKQEAEELVGRRTAEKEQAIGVARQQAEQRIREEEANTTTRRMAVIQIEQVRAAEIERDRKVVAAEQAKRTAVIDAEGHAAAQIAVAEGDKQSTVLKAEATLEQATREATGTRAKGEAQGAAETAVNVAAIAGQRALAETIGNNAGYQSYLISIRQVEMGEHVGVAQAKALEHANIKVIANTGNAVDGISSAREILSPKGGSMLGAAIEAFANTPTGAAILSRAGVKPEETNGHG